MHVPAELAHVAQAQEGSGAGVQAFATTMQKEPQLWACFQSASNYSAFTQQRGSQRGGAGSSAASAMG
jgi:hypothetical protein